MMNQSHSLNIQERRSFAKKLLLFSPLIGLVWTSILFFTGLHESWSWLLWGTVTIIGCSLGFLGYLSATLGNAICLVWSTLLKLIDQLIVWTLLPSFFYLILFPYSVLIRACRKNQIKNGKGSRQSYWQDAEEINSAERYFRQF